MSKIALLGKQQPMYIRKDMQKFLEENGHEVDILEMPTRNAPDWIDELKGYNALITCGEKFPAEVFEALQDDLKIL